MLRSIGELEADYNAAVDRLDTFKKRAESDAEIDDAFRAEWDEALWSCNRLQTELEDTRAAVRARAQHQPVSTRTVPSADGSGMLRMSISEPDRYEKRGRAFFHDVYRSQILGDVVATQRLLEHQEYELEKRAMTSSTFGGLIPPQYLLDLYAKAPRAGRKFLDACNHRDLPETGMSLIVPRLTQGTAAASQSAENQTVATQDLAETDLT
ncbi:MAG TPA: hypothetical protein VFL58_10040, partial [Gaiellaceae bacterium]|nr:hypothetical protein [Gaiellaceae bacterium]